MSAYSLLVGFIVLAATVGVSRVVREESARVSVQLALGVLIVTGASTFAIWSVFQLGVVRDREERSWPKRRS